MMVMIYTLYTDHEDDDDYIEDYDDDDEVLPAGKANVATWGVLGIKALVVTVLTLVIDMLI